MPLNLVSRTIGVMLSACGLARVADVSASLQRLSDEAFEARFAAANILEGKQAFAGGKVTRRDPDFLPPSIGPNALNDQYGDLLLRRCRAMQYDIPVIKGACEFLVSMVIGPTGILVAPNTGDTELDKLINAEWETFSKAVDNTRRRSMVDQQCTLLRELFNGGEVFAHRTFANPIRGFADGPCCNLIERERVPLNDIGLRSRAGVPQGHAIRHGVEFDAENRPVAYHVLKAAPDDDAWFSGQFTSGMDSTRIDAANIEQIFEEHRLGQIRGVPWCVSVVSGVRDEDAFMEAMIYLARQAASMGVVITGVPSDIPVAPQKKDSLGTAIVDMAGRAVRQISPGAFLRLTNKDAKAQVLAGNLPPPSIETAERVMLKKIAAGLGLPYAHLARDYSQTTYSAARQEELIDRRTYRRLQMMIANKHSVPLYVHWLKHAVTVGVLAGKLSASQRAMFLNDAEASCKCKVRLPGYEWVDPAKDASATQLELQMGVTSVPRVCAEKGRDFVEVLNERLDAEKLEAELRQQKGLPPAVAVQPTSIVFNENENGQDKTKTQPPAGGEDDDAGEDVQQTQPAKRNSPRDNESKRYLFRFVGHRSKEIA